MESAVDASLNIKGEAAIAAPVFHQRFLDKGHHKNAIFYSPEGSAIELQDAAELQIQVPDGEKVLRSEDVTMHYVALLTATENSWKVRVLESVPGF